MKLSELLRIPMFNEARVMAGATGMDREIHSVNMMDAPDISEFLKKNELLITTAYALKDNVQALEKLITEMARKQCAGLGIKTKRFLQDIPSSIVDIAEQSELPLIELPERYALGEMLNVALDCILEKRTEELRSSIKAREKFSRLIIQGKGVNDVVHSLGKTIHQSVALLDRHGDLLTSSTPLEPGFEEDLRAVMGSLLNVDSIENPAPTLASSPQAVMALTAIPIVPNQRLGFLFIFAPTLSLDPLSRAIMEQAANIIGFEMLKVQAVRERSRRYKNEFFSDFMEDRMTSEREILSRGKGHGLQVADFYQCIVAKVDSSERNNRKQPMGETDVERDLVYEQIRYELRRRGMNTILFSKNHGIGILSYDVTTDLEPIIDTRNSFLEIQQNIHRKLSLNVSFGIGNPVFKLTDIPKSFRQAEEAVDLGYRNYRRFFVHLHQTKETVDLLRLIPRRELEQYRDAALGPILSLAEGEQDVLLATVSAFLDHHGNIAETAKAMFLHRNTVLYRLNKCELISGVSFKDSEVSLRFRLAILIHTMILSSEMDGTPKLL